MSKKRGDGSYTYRTISIDFWSDPYIETLTAEEKLLYLYLITSRRTNHLGIIEYSPKGFSFELDMPNDAVDAGLQKFVSDGKIVRDGQILWLRNFMKDQTRRENENMLICRRRLMQDLDSDKIRAAIFDRYPMLADATTETPCDVQPADEIVAFVGHHQSDNQDAAAATLQRIVNDGQDWAELRSAIEWGADSGNPFWANGKLADLSRLARKTESGTLYGTLIQQYKEQQAKEQKDSTRKITNFRRQILRS